MKVVIMRGIPGAGKSTYIKGNLPLAYVVSADHYFMINGVYTFDSNKLQEAHNQCLRDFTQKIAEWNELIVVDNTNTSLTEIAPYAALALAYGYELEIITIHLSPEKCFQRQIHGVPEGTIHRMFYRLLEANLKFPSYWPHTIIHTLED